MNRLLLALTVLALPLTTHAQTQKKEVSPEIIQEAVKTYVPALCEDGVKGFAEAVKQCYLTTDEKDPKIEKCMLGDMLVGTFARRIRKQAEKLGDDDPTKDNTFISDKSWTKRFNHYFNLPKFKNMSGKEAVDYFIKGENKVSNISEATCPN